MVSRIARPELRQSFTPKKPPASLDGQTPLVVNGEAVSVDTLLAWANQVAPRYSQYVGQVDNAQIMSAILQDAVSLCVQEIFTRDEAQRRGCQVSDLVQAVAPTPDKAALEAYVKENDLLCAKHILAADMDTINAVLDGLEAVPTLDQFNALLTVFGTDPGMESNPSGYLFGPGEMVPEFEAGVRALEIGAYTPTPVQSQFGYHIIWRLDPLEHPDLAANYQNSVLNGLYQSFLDQSDLQVNNALLDQLAGQLSFAQQ